MINLETSEKHSYYGGTTFCESCGARHKGEFYGRYDGRTGEKLMEPICSKNPCQHSGHRWKESGSNFLYWKYICERCGENGSSFKWTGDTGC